jgi:hypothetical protein
MSTPAFVAGNGSNLSSHHFRRKRSLNIEIKLVKVTESPTQLACTKCAIVIDYDRSLFSSARHTRPAVSQHLTVLLQSRLVCVRQDGTRRLYQANLDEVERLRSELQAFWGGPLLRLKATAERAQKRKKGKQ